MEGGTSLRTGQSAETSAERSIVSVEIPRVEPDAWLLLPTGIATPHDEVLSVRVEGGCIARHLSAEALGLGALLVRPEAERLVLSYAVGPAAGAPYPDAAFWPRRTRYTEAAAELASAARETAAAAGGGAAAIQALAEEAQARFAYAHPEVRFNEGHETVPYLSCGTTPGSCVDINTYFVAALRAAGFEAAYLAGYFFPQERDGLTNDMHCWVVTRHDGDVLEWDIAHHMKAGLGTVRPGLNPRPGRRVALGHSMGHRYRLPEGPLDLKLLAEPLWVRGGHALAVEALTIRIA